MTGIKLRIHRLLYAGRFEPFRIKLVNGDYHDIADPQTVSLECKVVFIAENNQNWVVFSNTKINSIESLMEDYKGKLLEHESSPQG
jgi:hypothetical protein